MLCSEAPVTRVSPNSCLGRCNRTEMLKETFSKIHYWHKVGRREKLVFSRSFRNPLFFLLHPRSRSEMDPLFGLSSSDVAPLSFQASRLDTENRPVVPAPSPLARLHNSCPPREGCRSPSLHSLATSITIHLVCGDSFLRCPCPLVLLPLIHSTHSKNYVFESVTLILSLLLIDVRGARRPTHPSPGGSRHLVSPALAPFTCLRLHPNSIPRSKLTRPFPITALLLMTCLNFPSPNLPCKSGSLPFIH